MLHALLILAFAVLVVRDQGVGPLVAAPAWLAAACTLGPMLMALGVMALTASRALRELNAGRVSAVMTADAVHAGVRWVLLSAHVVGVLGLGWLDTVRRLIGAGSHRGDLILIDEALAIFPLLLGLAACWWMLYPIDRRLREAVLIRELDEGRTIHPMPFRARSVMLHVRHQLLITLLPLMALTAWSETVAWAAGTVVDRASRDLLGLREPGWVHTVARWLTDENSGPLLMGGVQLAGALAVLAMVPILLRLTWDTVPLGAGPTRDRLVAMCRGAGVYVRELLVWRTSGTMINGAVLGVVRPWRYILLTDALLEQLSERQVEAVMAHEIAHVRKAHLPWMLAGLLGVTGLVGVLVDMAFRMLNWRVTQDQAQFIEIGAALGAVIVALLALGFISRRFEWQADAFAAGRMSSQDPAAGGRVTPEGAGAMQAALRAVAYLNHIPAHKFSFRHGSIATRLHRLDSAVGQTAGKLPIDRTVRRVKWGIALLLVVNVGAMTWAALR